MFSTSILDAMATFGYAISAFGVVCCVIAYFALPKLVKIAFSEGGNDEDSQS